MPFDPNLIKYISFSSQTDGKKRKVNFTIETADIIAIFGGIVALAFTAAMIAGWVPINKLTVSLASCSAVGAVIAQIVKASTQKKQAKTKPKKKNK